MRVTCAVLFLVFTFVYLYDYQADILAVGQHVLSDGQTHYDRTIGAILITLILYLLHLAVFGLTCLSKRTHALTYFPSLLLLTFLTDISPDIDRHFTVGAWAWVLPLLLLIYMGGVWAIRKYRLDEVIDEVPGFFSKTMWQNVLVMVLMFFMVGLFSNHDDRFHYRMHAERCLIAHDYKGVLSTGEKSLATDPSMTMIRTYALARKGLLGEELFEYPVTGGSKALLPDGQTVKLMMVPEKEIYRFLGLWMKQKMEPMHYLNFIIRHHVARRPAYDYLLCGYLLDRDLDTFVRTVGKYYELEKQLPKHYREALTLYTHLHSSPVVVYHSSVMDADFQDFQDLLRRHPNRTERMNAIRDTYGDTYWYYFLTASNARTQLQSSEN